MSRHYELLDDKVGMAPMVHCIKHYKEVLTNNDLDTLCLNNTVDRGENSFEVCLF